jgi:iron complex transport system substrate-binding protein
MFFVIACSEGVVNIGGASTQQVLKRDEQPVDETFPITVEDSLGRNVTIDKSPNRIVAYDAALVEILFSIGEGNRIVGTHSFVDYPVEASEIPKVGGAFEMDIESIIELDPDLVYVFFPTFVEPLEAAGLKVLYIETLKHDFRAIAANIRLWGQIVGNPTQADIVASQFTSRIEKIRSIIQPGVDGPRVLNDLGMLWASGSDTLEQEVFDLLNVHNIASSMQGYAQISIEEIVAGDPEYIFTLGPDEFLNNEAFNAVSAVQKGNVITLDEQLLTIAGPRFAQGIETLAKLLYPDLF